MRSDWYNTWKLNTYLIVPAGTGLALATLPDEVRSLLSKPLPRPYAVDVESAEMAGRFEVLGVDCCLLERGYCVLRY